MSGGRRLVGDAAIYLGANILNAAIPFLLLPVLTRVLTPADYGTIAMFGVMLTLIGAFTGLSVHGAVSVRYFQMDSRELAGYIGTCMLILLLSTSLVFGIVALFGANLESMSGLPYVWLLLVVLLSGVQFVVQIRLTVWQATGAAKRYGAFQISQSLCNALLSLALILLAGMTWQGRVLGQALAISVFGILAFYWLYKDESISMPRAWCVHGKDALKFGVPLIPHVIGAVAIATGGQFLVTKMLGVADTGIYVLALQFGAAFGLAADAFVKAYGPWLYKKLQENSEEARLYVVGITYLVFIFFALSSLLFSWVIYLAFGFFVGAEFMPARNLVFLFVLANGFVGMYYAVAGFFFFSSRTQYISALTISSGLISLVLMYSLGREFGLKGFAGGYFVSQLLLFLLAWVISMRISPMPWRKLNRSISMVLSGYHWSRKYL